MALINPSFRGCGSHTNGFITKKSITTMTFSQLADFRDQLQEQDTYELFNRMLISQEPFVPQYVKPQSRQCSSHMHGFNNHYSS